MGTWARKCGHAARLVSLYLLFGLRLGGHAVCAVDGVICAKVKTCSARHEREAGETVT